MNVLLKGTVKPIKRYNPDHDLFDIKTDIAIAKFEQFGKDAATKARKQSKSPKAH